MARSRKKKWKSRIKKALKLAAIGGAGYLAAKRFGGNRQGTASVNPVGGVDQIAADAAAKAPVTDVVNPNLNKVAANVGNTGSTFNTRFSKPAEETMSKAMRSQILQAKANAPRGIIRPGSVPMSRTGIRVNQPGSPIIKQYKKGGRVTGIAKRGFGRALMKGKK